MPDPWRLERREAGGQVLVTFGPRAVFSYAAADAGMRNLAVVSVTEAGVSVNEAAAVFALTPQYVSMLRGRARKDGAAGLVKPRGRPSKLTPRQWMRARRWAGEGWTQQRIAEQLG